VERQRSKARIGVTVLLLAFLLPFAAAPQAAIDPVLVNFRDYRAALERGDLTAAEVSATAALAASEAARGPRTAVLALNLANLRLELGKPYDALTPARTAHDLASASAAAGVDPIAAALTLGRAEIAANQRTGARRLLDAFEAAEGQTALDTDVYNAAVALGRWGNEDNDYAAARMAWGRAARLANTTDDPPFAHARAAMSQAVAIARAGFDRSMLGHIGIDWTFSPADQKSANDALSVALLLLRERAFSDTPPAGELTPSQTLYAHTLAWQAAVFAKVQSLGDRLPAPLTTDADIVISESARCVMRVIRTGGQIEFPREALDRWGVGAVVVYLAVDAEGATTSRGIGAAVPPGVLADGIAAAIGGWRTEKDSSAAPDCVMPTALFIPMHFVLD
jgi:hypothetical protein